MLTELKLISLSAPGPARWLGLGAVRAEGGLCRHDPRYSDPGQRMLRSGIGQVLSVDGVPMK